MREYGEVDVSKFLEEVCVGLAGVVSSPSQGFKHLIDHFCSHQFVGHTSGADNIVVLHLSGSHKNGYVIGLCDVAVCWMDYG
ncbi:hypothetical protein L9G16_18905, partial [Shewanella sp. A25]|nr:hypothetical protein [Shewanella shenzhenensis]